MPEIHPLVVHFPIALLSSAILFDFIYILSGRNELSKTGWWVLFLGLVSAMVGMATGIWNDRLFDHFGSVTPLWINHGWVQIFSSFIFICLFSWRTKCPNILNITPSKWGYLFIGTLAVAILFYGGHLGAKLAGRI